MAHKRNPELAAHIAGRIRKRREELGISQVALGDALGWDYTRQSRIESGHISAPGAGTLLALARGLAVTPDYFFQGLDMTPIAVPQTPASAALARRIASLPAEKRAEIMALLNAA